MSADFTVGMYDQRGQLITSVQTHRFTATNGEDADGVAQIFLKHAAASVRTVYVWNGFNHPDGRPAADIGHNVVPDARASRT